MACDLWNKKLSRSEFLKAGAGLALATTVGGSVLAACGSSSPSGASSASSAASIKAEPDGDLYYFSFADYVEPTLVTGFEKEYGVKVNQSFFDSDEAMVTKVASGLPFDCVTTNSGYLQRLASGGLLRELPHDQLQNYGNLQEYFLDPFYDPGAKYSVPYGYSPIGIGWRTDQVSESDMTGSWNDLWDNAGAKGKIYITDIVGYALGASLARLGYDINSGNADEVNKAADEIIKLKPSLAGFSSSDQLSSGQGWIQQFWPGGVYQALSQMKDPGLLKYENCKESAIMGSDLMSIPAAAKHPGTALLFIDWILQPEHSSANVKYTGYPSGTKTGEVAYASLTKEFPWLQMSSDVLSQPNTWKIAPTGTRLALWNNAWSRVMAG